MSDMARPDEAELDAEQLKGDLDGTHQAAVTAWFAFERLSQARTLGAQADAFNDLSNAMSDLASWLPGYDIETGRIEGHDDDA